MTSERVASGAKVALLGAALLFLMAACGEQVPEETNQGSAPTTEQSTAAATGQATEGEQQ